MPKKPDLTVIVPTYNGERFLSSTLDSIGRQEDVDLEVLVVDDGSTDATARIAAEHRATTRLIQQRNLGVAVARNHGLAEASAPRAAFVDQDDLWHPSRARTLLGLLDANETSLAATTETPFAIATDREGLAALGDGRERWPQAYVNEGYELDELMELASHDAGHPESVETISTERLSRGPATLTTAFVFDRITALSAGGCATFVRALDDHVLYLNMTRIAGPAVRLGDPLLYYRVHPQSATVSSPLAKAYLSTMLAVRWGRVFPTTEPSSDYIEHLLRQLPESDLTRTQQLSLLRLSAPNGEQGRLARQWAKSMLKNVLPGPARRLKTALGALPHVRTSHSHRVHRSGDRSVI